MSRPISINDTLSCHPTSFDSANSSYNGIYSSYVIENGYTDSSSTTRAAFQANTGSNAESVAYYVFDCSEIPVGATINSISCTAKVGNQGTNYFSTRTVQLCTGTTGKGSATTVTGTNSSPGTYNLTVGTWTAAEVRNAKLKLYVKRGTKNTNTNATFSFFGATLTVSYSFNGTEYEITASSSVSGVTVEPASQYVISGSATVLIHTSSLTGITVTDNGNNVNSQLVPKSAEPSYSLETQGSYGFTLNSNNYYQSDNKGVSKSCAVTRVHFSLPTSATITFQYINYAEQGYDFGVFGKVDTALSTSYYAAGSSGATITDSEYERACNTSSYNSSSVQTLTYSNVSAGEHYIDVKYSKDDASDSNNDTLQFKVSITLNGTAEPYYEYTIASVSADHAILVTSSAVDILYLKENGSWVAFSGVVYKKVNGSWVQQSNLQNVFDTNTNYVRG